MRWHHEDLGKKATEQVLEHNPEATSPGQERQSRRSRISRRKKLWPWVSSTSTSMVMKISLAQELQHTLCPGRTLTPTPLAPDLINCHFTFCFWTFPPRELSGIPCECILIFFFFRPEGSILLMWEAIHSWEAAPRAKLMHLLQRERNSVSPRPGLAHLPPLSKQSNTCIIWHQGPTQGNFLAAPRGARTLLVHQPFRKYKCF